MGRLRPLVVLFLPLSVAVAGCVDGAVAPRESRDGDHLHGLFFVCEDGTVIDPGDYTDHHGESFRPASRCPSAEAEAAVALTFERTSLTLFETTRFFWDVTPKGKSGGVANVTQVRIADQSAEDRIVRGQPKAVYGESLEERTVVELPAAFDATWRPREVGLFYFRAYAEVAGKHVWSSESVVEVVQIEPTGVVHEVTFETGLPGPTTDPEVLAMVAGDSVVFVNNDILPRRVHTTTGPEEFDTGDIPAGDRSEEIVLLTPGTYTYRSDDPSPIRGEIQAGVPDGA